MSSSENTPSQHPSEGAPRASARVWELIERIGAASAIWAAVESGLLRELADAPQTVDAIAKTLGSDPRPTGYILDLLVGEGLAERHDGGYTRSRLFAGRTDLLDRSALDMWRSLPALLRGAAPAWVMDGDPDERARVYRQVTPTIGEIFEPAAREVAARLGAVGRVIDLGCGSGVWSLAMAARDPNCHVTGVDFEPVLPAMAERAARLGLADRVTLLAADLRRDPLPDGFDTVVVANVLRLEPAPVARQMLANAYACARPGGRLVVIDALAHGSIGARRSVALYALNLSLRTRRGVVHSAASVVEWLRASGATTHEQVALGVPPDHLGVVVATKPRQDEVRP